MRNILTRPDLALPREYLAAACALARAHRELTALALARYGDHGPQVSGCIRDHFPEVTKDELRRLGRAINASVSAAWAAKPSRIPQSTMRKLSCAVATRDGSGFYGPQP
jgi:hypothetical protein